MPELTTTLYTNAELPAALRPVLTAWDAECFTEANPYDWASPQWHLFVTLHGEPVSYVGLFLRDCLLDGQPLALAGIGSVMTPQNHRHNGYASAGLKATNAALRRVTAAPFALLVTKTKLIPFYERLGWAEIHDPMWVQTPDGGRQLYDDIRMVQALRGDPWPGGTLDLCGLPW